MAFALFVSATSAARISPLTSASFDAVTKLDAPDTDWFIAFHATNCKYFKQLQPTLSAVADALDGRLQVGSVDGSRHGDLKTRFDVRRTPTVLFFHRGRMYPFKGPQTVEYMTEYASGLFLEIDRANPNFKRYFEIPPWKHAIEANESTLLTAPPSSPSSSSTRVVLTPSDIKSEL
ncbi:hypothetical protein ACHHYP_14717 [Achlya hypogyna]|uniref:Thioredoxin domain-containing protein n=1 Tax=Achlya hypogyna TaxID=1202772 RepID=A0A1V9YCK8_ACHHY|nr:hypothetical protein ACHHYP_14717 [Achlya hypogyna]